MTKITILTPSYNQAQFIEENIISVQAQAKVEVEHIVIDGGSTDGTLAILKKYPHLKYLSEKDEGQADALQKGLEMSTGDIVGWINSDDYLEPDVLSQVVDSFESANIDWLVGDITFLFDKDKYFRPEKSAKITRQSLLSDPNILRQQGTFFRKRALQNVGGFDKKYQMVMDLDLWFRLLSLSEPLMIDRNMAYFRIHADQKTSGKQIKLQTKEILDVFRKNKSPLCYRFKIAWRNFFFGKYLQLIFLLRK
ncbi:hypothetical protein AwDysgo_03260 [Bacteroidales bacterium]|nr:hypothetical protein AwDysgo_03260 [Bacteroidales bacterium]